MNGIHDLGGMHGMGPIEREENEPVFHGDWEKRVFGLFFALSAHGRWNLDQFRHAIERMDPSEYLTTSYYEHWLHAHTTMAIETGLITAEEFQQRCKEIAAEAA
jgi:nitrile hydratase